MNIWRPFLLLLMPVVLAGCHRSLNSSGASFGSTNGAFYSFLVAEKSLSAPIVLLSRSGGPGKNYAMSWTTSGDRVLVDGKPLAFFFTPTVYYKEDGKLKSMAISKSGIWLPFFDKNGPSVDEMEQAFDTISRGP